MGYSIAFPARNQKIKKEMLQFMEKNLKSFKEITGVFEGSYYGVTDDLSYDHGRLSLGFNYSGGGEMEAAWRYAVIRWMAIRAGKKRDFKKENLKNVPYYVYDGHEKVPVLVYDGRTYDKYRKDHPHFLCTAIGESYHINLHIEFIARALNDLTFSYQLTVPMREELWRLDKLWKKRKKG